MCGIAGFATAADDSVGAERLGEGIANRGPDGISIGTFGSWCLVQARLAIIDLSDRVVYPMTNEDDTIALVFNGEIYNHDELRAQLEQRGHHFANRCDAEVIVHGWEEWGEGVFSRLSGMFAIALADTRTDELILARDRLGIKPLAHTTGERFGFASDAFALVGAGLSRGEIDTDAVAEFTAFHYVPQPLTGLRDVRQLEPGAVLRRRGDGETVVRRWAPEPFSDARAGAVPTAGELDAALVAATRRHLVADVEVGILLSGGTDSRLLLALAAELGAHPAGVHDGLRGLRRLRREPDRASDRRPLRRALRRDAPRARLRERARRRRGCLRPALRRRLRDRDARRRPPRARARQGRAQWHRRRRPLRGLRPAPRPPTAPRARRHPCPARRALALDADESRRGAHEPRQHRPRLRGTPERGRRGPGRTGPVPAPWPPTHSSGSQRACSAPMSPNHGRRSRPASVCATRDRGRSSESCRPSSCAPTSPGTC